MPSREEHCARDMWLLGKEFPEVHQLLDQFANYPDMEFLTRHRKFLHHKEGIEYIRMKMGEEAARSAEQHIKDDCGGYVPNAIDYYIDVVDNFGYLKA